LAECPEGGRAMGAKGLAYVAREYDRKVLAGRLADVFARLVGAPTWGAEPSLANQSRRSAGDLLAFISASFWRHR
jgi:hypothetical protein